MKKVAIVGVEGSGKTVMLAGLGDLYTYPDEEGYMLVPKNFSTAAYVAEKIERMRKGEWPAATADDVMEGLDWTLKRRVQGGRQRPETICEVSFLDFAGEVYRTAFGIGEGDQTLADQAEELKRYVREADDLLVLINLRDVIVHGVRDRRVQEAMWITKAILDAALAEEDGHKAPRAAIVLSQADSYAETINECGGAKGVLQKHLPYVAYDYEWLDVFAASAVDKTRLDDGGNVVPEADFTEKGLLPILAWIREGMAVDGGRGTNRERPGGSRGTTTLPGKVSGGGRGATALPGGTRVPSADHQAGDVKTLVLPGGAKMEMVWCPPGEFMMGSPRTEAGRGNDETQHRVTLTKGFWLGKYPVTQAQWQSVMGSNPSYFKGGTRPVENVSWDDCQKFIEKLNCGVRLPTEAEWEYACRAGTTGAYGGTGNLDEMGWYYDNPEYVIVEREKWLGLVTEKVKKAKHETYPVGKKKPNAWGLFDMHGNVWEWCDGNGMRLGLRGGGWLSAARFCRSAYSVSYNPGYRDYDSGFRLCCSAGPRG